MASILGGAGKPLRVWRGRTWRQAFGWSEPRRYWLDTGGERTGYLVDVPDLQLFPKHFGARSVVFRAGLELGWMNRGLAAFGWVQRRLKLKLGRWSIGLAQWIAQRFETRGTDRGGMVVIVVGTKNGEAIKRTWRLVVEAGDGPYTPATVARAILRTRDNIRPGARPALAEVSLSAMEEAFSDLAATTSISEEPCPPLFPSILKSDFDTLAPEVQRTHQIHDLEQFSGEAKVTRGTNPLARVIAAIFRFPRQVVRCPCR